MYLKIKLLNYYNTIVYCKIIEETKSCWVINILPKISLINQKGMYSFVKNKPDYMRFNKRRNYNFFGYEIIKPIKDSEIKDMDSTHVYN